MRKNDSRITTNTIEKALPGITPFTMEGFPLPMTISSLPSANVLSDGIDALLLKAAEKNGTEVLGAPFPGEPQGMQAIIRPDLWGIRMLYNKGFLGSLKKRAKRFDNIDDAVIPIGFIASSAGSFFLSFYMSVALQHYAHLDTNSGWGLFASMATFTVLLVAGATLTIFANKRVERPLHNLNRVMSTISCTWPRKLLSVLKKPSGLGIQLSSELQALKIILERMTYGNDDSTERNWMKLSLGDEIGMITLTASLDNQMHSMLQGSQLALGGESSELVHRACAAAFPGKMESLLDHFQSPALVKV